MKVNGLKFFWKSKPNFHPSPSCCLAPTTDLNVPSWIRVSYFFRRYWFVSSPSFPITDCIRASTFWTFQRATPVYLHNLPPNIKNPCRQAANGRVHCDEQNCRKDKNGEQECRSRIHTFQATPNGYISIEEQITIEERFSKSQEKLGNVINFYRADLCGINKAILYPWSGPWLVQKDPRPFSNPDFEILKGTKDPEK